MPFKCWCPRKVLLTTLFLVVSSTHLWLYLIYAILHSRPLCLTACYSRETLISTYLKSHCIFGPHFIFFHNPHISVTNSQQFYIFTLYSLISIPMNNSSFQSSSEPNSINLELVLLLVRFPYFLNKLRPIC